MLKKNVSHARFNAACYRYPPATLADIVVGRTLYHAYGFDPRVEHIQELHLWTGPISSNVLLALEKSEEEAASHYAFRMKEGMLEENQSQPDWFMATSFGTDRYPSLKGYTVYHSLKDCGIGANYNQNRLFISKERAINWLHMLHA